MHVEKFKMPRVPIQDCSRETPWYGSGRFSDWLHCPVRVVAQGNAANSQHLRDEAKDESKYAVIVGNSLKK